MTFGIKYAPIFRKVEISVINDIFFKNGIDVSFVFVIISKEGNIIGNGFPDWVWRKDSLTMQIYHLEGISINVLNPNQLLDEKKVYEKGTGRKLRPKDIESMKVEKNKFSVLCNIKSGKKGKRARVYFKELEGEMKTKIEAYINKKILENKEPSTMSKPTVKKIDKKAKKKKQKMDEHDRKVAALFDEADEDAMELICPACGADVLYKPGMKRCPICDKKVNFI